MIIKDTPVSGTMLAKNMDDAFTRNQLIQFLKKQNLLDGNGEPTERGIRNGISYQEMVKNGKNARWLVYDKECQQRIQKCIPYIEKEVVPSTTRKKKPKSKSEGSQKTVIEMDRSFLNDIPFSTFKVLPLDQSFVVLDTETTGLSKEDEVVELGIIDMKGNVLYESLFSHVQPMNPDAQKVNHLTEAELSVSPCIKEEAEKILSLLEGKVVIGHNISFDENLLRQSFERYGVEFNGFESKYDSRKLVKDAIISSSYSLERVAKLLGISGEEKHRAVDDCRWTLKMLENLEKLLQISSICKK